MTTEIPLEYLKTYGIDLKPAALVTGKDEYFLSQNGKTICKLTEHPKADINIFSKHEYDVKSLNNINKVLRDLGCKVPAPQPII